MLIELNQLLTSTGGGRVVDLRCRRSLSLGWDGMLTLDVEDPSVCSRGRQISLM